MKKYVIIRDVNAEIDFSQVDQDGIDPNLIDNTNQAFVVSYDGSMPQCISIIDNKSKEYTKEEIIPILCDPDWSIYVDLCEEDEQEYLDHITFYQEIL